MYWLCQDENVPGVIPGTPTSKTRIREALAIAVAMGANTIRIISCGTSVGTPYSIESSLNKFGNWDSSDYVIFAAREYGLRVVLPLTDNYDYYHGGKYTFLRWLGVSLDNYGIRFYNNTSVIRAYTVSLLSVIVISSYRPFLVLFSVITDNELNMVNRLIYERT
jgi:mannan endo-1,4-beta-mannosidase